MNEAAVVLLIIHFLVTAGLLVEAGVAAFKASLVRWIAHFAFAAANVFMALLGLQMVFLPTG